MGDAAMVEDVLHQAIAEGKPVTVRYFGGSNPGAERDIQPLSIKGDKLRALCMSSGETKAFLLEKIEIVLDGVPSEMINGYVSPPPTFPTLAEFAESYTAQLQALEWCVVSEEGKLSLYRIQKNGQVLKSPDVSLSFVRDTYDSLVDLDTWTTYEANHRERSRPWVVAAKRETTKAYSDHMKAQRVFLDLATSKAVMRGKK